MANIERFTFNPFGENTYVLYGNSECAIIDPGCYTSEERKQLREFIESNGLRVKYLLNTHCHLDHILGNKFVADTYNLSPVMHKTERKVLEMGPASAQLYGFNYDPSPEPQEFIDEDDIIEVAGVKLKTLFVPGHAPGHVVFYCEEEGWILGGDVLFQGSIGRTDLPGGNHDQLIRNIKEKLLPLPEETIVYPGHGPETTIGMEKKINPFLR